MLELLNESIALVNLPFTFLMIVSVVYWLLMILGIVGMDHADAHADGGVDLHADAHADVDVHGDAAHGHHGGDGAGVGPVSAYLNFINGDRAPLAVILSFFFMSLWVLSIAANHIFNPAKSILIALIILVPNYILATLITKVVTIPFARLFGALKDPVEHQKPIMGSSCKVLNTIEGNRIGAAEVDHGGSLHRLNVKSFQGARIELGSEAVVVDQDVENGIYIIKGF